MQWSRSIKWQIKEIVEESIFHSLNTVFPLFTLKTNQHSDRDIKLFSIRTANISHWEIILITNTIVSLPEMMVTCFFFTVPLICLELKCHRKDDFHYERGGEIFHFPLFPVILILCEWSFCKSLIITHLYSYRQQCISKDPALRDPTANVVTSWAILIWLNKTWNMRL